MTARTLTAREYVAAFTTWRDLSRGKLHCDTARRL